MQLIHLSKTKQELISAQDVGEVKGLRDKYEILCNYAKRIGESLEMQDMCAEIKIRVERRADDILQEKPKQHGARPADNNAELQDATQIQTLSELGIEKTQSHRWQQTPLRSSSSAGFPRCRGDIRKRWRHWPWCRKINRSIQQINMAMNGGKLIEWKESS